MKTFVLAVALGLNAGVTLHVWRRPYRTEISGFHCPVVAPSATIRTVRDSTLLRIGLNAAGRRTQANREGPTFRDRVTKQGNNRGR